MPVSWYPFRPGLPLWLCVVLAVLVAVSLWHEHNWRRTLGSYAELRKVSGAADAEDWPSSDFAWLMGVQLWLVLFAAAMLAIISGIAVWTALIWPHRPFGFETPIDPSDLPYVWGLAVAGCAATVATCAIAWDIWRSPWTRVANKVRRAVYASASKRALLFDEALALDPGMSDPGVGVPVEQPLPDPGVDQPPLDSSVDQPTR